MAPHLAHLWKRWSGGIPTLRPHHTIHLSGKQANLHRLVFLALLATGMPMGKIFEVKPEEVESYAKKGVKDEK